MKKNKSTIILILVFFVGLSVMLYPTLSDYVNQLHQSRAVATYAEDVDNLTDADYSAYFEAADAFNAQIAAGCVVFPATLSHLRKHAGCDRHRHYGLHHH